MAWTCDCCGWKNFCDDRIGMQEPHCIRCGRPRGSRAATIAKLEIDIDNLMQDLAALKKRQYHTQEIINALEHDLSQYTLQRSDLITEIKEASATIASARKRLATFQAYEPGTNQRQIAEDQRTLTEVEV